jgi:hypothetical protein
MAEKLRILYVAPLGERDSSLYRLWALERAGQDVVRMPVERWLVQQHGLAWKLGYRLATSAGTGPLAWEFNRELLRTAEAERPEVVWLDKMLLVTPRTLERLRGMGATVVNYCIDNPFGTRGDPGWALYMKCIPHYDLHIVQRDKNIEDYTERGARSVLKIQTAYEPTLHYPPPAGWSDKDRTRDVSFIGTPYDERPEFLLRLKREFGVALAVNGTRRLWEKRMTAAEMAEIYAGDEIYLHAYREAIWRSKINLSFLTHSNADEFAHKSFEIAGCGGFLLAERCKGHLERFVEDEEAVYFSDVEECAAKIARYLGDEAARARIAAAGARRAAACGYGNDGQVGKILERIDALRGAGQG